MNFDPKAIRRALMVAKSIATQIDPGFAKINVPMPPEGVPLERAAGGSADAPQIGINVRSDTKAGIRYADEIVDGNKAYETRDTDSLRPYVGKRVAIVRTGEGPAKAIGEVTVGKPIVANQDMFHRLRDQHLVPAGSAFDIKPGSTKHLYPMHDPVRYDNERGVGAGIVARKVMERAAGGKTDPDLQTAQRLGFDTSSIPEIRRAGELNKFHQSMMGSVSETAQKMQDLGNEYHQSGLLPHPIGTLLHTPFSKKNGQPPLRITGHYVDPKNPSRYGYMFEQGESSGTAMVSDPKADERIRKTNPDWDREKYWSQAQPLTGPQGFAKAKGGAIKTVEGPERDQNLAEFMRGAHPEFLDQEGRARKFYHITPKSFSQFKPGGTKGQQQLSGPAIFMSPDPEIQNAAHNVGGFGGEFKPGSNVMVLHANVKNPFIVDKSNYSSLNKNYPGMGVGAYLLSPEVKADLEDMGYDGIINKLKDDPRQHEFMAFYPWQVKSAFNKGTFDPSVNDITKARGGEVKTVQGPERERNLAEFMRGAHPAVRHEDGTPRIFYHETHEPEIREFASSEVTGNLRGEGVAGHFSFLPKTANHFAEQMQKFVEVIPPAKWPETGAVVYPVHLNVKNIFDPTNPEHLEKIGAAGKNLTHYSDLEENVGKIKKAGFDSYFDWEDRSLSNPSAIAVFDPKNIKSAVGNVGTFDPTDPDITKAEGGKVDAPQGYTPQPPGTLETDNPGGEWLEDKKQMSESRGYRPSGAPKSFGSVTAVWRDKKTNNMAPVYLPVSMLKQIPGVMNEQQNVREHSLNGLIEHMGSTGRLPKFSVDSDSEYHPFITVDQRGMPFVSEGNHRIMAADRLGWKWLPVEVRYFNGGEEVDGPLHPDRIRAMHGVEPAKKAEGGAVDDDEIQPRNLNPMGMYSAAAEAARAIPQERGTPQQMLATMKGVKPDELRWSGVQNKFANQKSVTRDELAQHFENQLPPIEESQASKYEQYTEPGGKNYREVLLHMPPDLTAQAYSEHEIQPFQSSHWEQPNVLAHVRLKDRELPSTKRPPKPDQRVSVAHRRSDEDGSFPTTETDAWSTKVPGLVVTRSIEPDEKGAFTVTHLGTGLAAARDLPYHKAQASAEALGKIWDGWHKDDQTVKDWAKNNSALARQTLSQVENPGAKKVLHIEELQSDWAQTGRDKKFRDNAAYSEAKQNKQDLENQLRDMTKARLMKIAQELEPGQEFPYKREILAQEYADFDKFSDYLEREQRRYFKNDDGTPSQGARYAAFNLEELPLEDGEHGLFLRNKYTQDFFNEDFLSPSDADALSKIRAVHSKIQGFDDQIKKNPEYLKQVVDHHVSKMTPYEMAAEHGPEWKEKVSKADVKMKEAASGVSEAPYVTNTNQWTDLALKRALTEAARGNYHQLMWTPGAAQVDRYKLSKFIDALRYKKYEDGLYHITAEKNGRTVHADKYKPEQLPGVVGQEIAKKIIAGEGEPTREDEDSAKVIKGLDLDVGGRGMYEYYDKIVPRRLMELVKEHDPSITVQPSKTKGATKRFPSIQITPKLRDSILKRGFKAFQRGGAVQGHLFHHHDVPKSAEVPVMDRDKAIRRAMMIAKQEGGAISGQSQVKGLPFPEEDTSFRLRTKLNREAKVAAGKPDPGLPMNSRMVIRAPKKKAGETQLPNFIVGPITHKDWIARHEKILSPEEIQHSSQWYKNIYGNFLQYTNNDEQQAKKLMRAWLVAQQNVSPAGAMQNVLLQREQMQRGVPEYLWRAGGMPNPTNAARSVLQDQQISGGVGQKIADFVDSAEGLDTRSYLGHDPRGGTPFVIDVHSARDSGLVDPALINHLKNLGYNENDLAKVQTDFEASPSDAQYENRAQWGRDLTKYLNKIGWQGKKNWRPEEVQAVGWMGMTKLTRNAEEDSASGLGKNLRRVSFELSPGEGSPWAQKYGTAFESLPDEERYGITRKMADRAMQIATEMSGVNPLSTVHGTGAWMQYQNPAAVGQALATQGGADIMANTIGHLLHQTEVWHNRVKPVTSSPKGFAIDFIESGSQNLADRGQLRDFWQKITDADKTGFIQGYQPITLPNGQVGVRALVDKGGLGTHKKLIETLQEGGELDSMLKELPFNIESQIAEAEITKARNDWKENQSGQAYLQRLSDFMGSDPSARLSAYGSQLEKELEGHLDEAYSRQGRSWRTTPGAASQKEVTPPPPPQYASGGAINHALRIAANVRGYGRIS